MANIPIPLTSDYKQSILNPDSSFDTLMPIEAILENGEPKFATGGFAIVFKMHKTDENKNYAIKCFTSNIDNRNERLEAIHRYISKISSPHFAKFQFLPKELWVNISHTQGYEYPIVAMEWIEGKTLGETIRYACEINDTQTLKNLLTQFIDLALMLMALPIAHGDLKHDNIIVDKNGTLVLVDYDGMFVPELKGQQANELGSEDYQHQSRNNTVFDRHIDDWSIAIIALSIATLIQKPSLFATLNNTQNLIFTRKHWQNNELKSIINFELHPTVNKLLQFITDSNHYQLPLLFNNMVELRDVVDEIEVIIENMTKEEIDAVVDIFTFNVFNTLFHDNNFDIFKTYEDLSNDLLKDSIYTFFLCPSLYILKENGNTSYYDYTILQDDENNDVYYTDLNYWFRSFKWKLIGKAYDNYAGFMPLFKLKLKNIIYDSDLANAPKINMVKLSLEYLYDSVYYITNYSNIYETADINTITNKITGFCNFQNPQIVWNLLSKELTGIKTDENGLGFDKMLNKINDLIPQHSYLKILKVYLEDNQNLKYHNEFALTFIGEDKTTSWWNSLSDEWKDILKTNFNITYNNNTTTEEYFYKSTELINSLSQYYSNYNEELVNNKISTTNLIYFFLNENYNIKTNKTWIPLFDNPKKVWTLLKSELADIKTDENGLGFDKMLHKIKELQHRNIFLRPLIKYLEDIDFLKFQDEFSITFIGEDKTTTWWNSLSIVWKNILARNYFRFKHRRNSGDLNFTQIDFSAFELFAITELKCNKEEINTLEHIKYLTKLTSLECWQTQINSLKGIENLINLRVLRCSNTKITNLKGIENLVNLIDLSCDNTQITSLNEIENLIHLKYLYLSNTQITSLDGIEKLVNLKYLDLSNNQISNLKNIEKLTNLTSLDLNNTQITSLNGIENLKNLDELECINTHITPDELNKYKLLFPNCNFNTNPLNL